MARHLSGFVAACALALSGASSSFAVDYSEPSGTFSIIALDETTGEFGLAVQSAAIAVGARTLWGKAGVGAIASQASSHAMYGEMGVSLLERGWSPEEALAFMTRGDAQRERRQVSIIDASGRTASWTSPSITDWKGHACRKNFCVQGNSLTGAQVVSSIADAFEKGSGPLPERLLAALDAGEAAGGDKRGVQSAAILILRKRAIQDYGDRALDIRVDDSPAPLVELRRVLGVVRAQETLAGLDVLITDKKFAEAETRVIDSALRHNPRNHQAHVMRADIKLRMGDRTGALRELAEAIALNPKQRRLILSDPDFASLKNEPVLQGEN